MQSEMPDDLDRLYDKIEWENPQANLTGRVMARVQELQSIQRISMLLSLAALAALGVFAFALGRGMTLSGGLDYLIVLVNNLDVAFESTDEFFSGLLDVMPWLEIAAVTASVLALWLASAVLPRFLTARRSKSS